MVLQIALGVFLAGIALMLVYLTFKWLLPLVVIAFIIFGAKMWSARKRRRYAVPRHY